MRGVDHEELIHEASADSLLEVDDAEAGDELLEESGLGDLFGIELDDEETDGRGGRQPGTDETVDRVASEIPEIVTRQELLEAGVPAGTIGNWRRTGKLEATDERGVYRASRGGRAWIRSYLEERGLDLPDG